jgi:hypothetical protein
MSVELLHLPYDIPVAPMDQIGYAASNNRETALRDPFLERCERDTCALRGDTVPPLLSASGGLHATARMARAMARTCGETAFGYLFRIEIHALVALPSPSMAARLNTAKGSKVWNALRPCAETGEFHGILFPQGLIFFELARAEGALKEEYLWSVKSDGGATLN